MFNLFKRKNEIKELKCRVAVLETQVTALNTQKGKGIDFSKSWGEGFNLKEVTFKGVEIKDAKFIDELAKKVCSRIEENKENQNKNNRELVLQIDGDVIGKVVLNNLIKNKQDKILKSIDNKDLSSSENNYQTIQVGKLTEEEMLRFNLGKYSRR